MSDYTEYVHHGNVVVVRKDLKGKHRDHCLCFSCTNHGNCSIEGAVYNRCVEFSIVTPVWECPNFKQK